MSRQELGEESPNILPRLFIGHSGSVEREELPPEKREEKIKTMTVKDMLQLEEPQVLRREINQKMARAGLFSHHFRKKVLRQIV